MSVKQQPTIQDWVGQTPLVRLQRLQPAQAASVYLKLEGNNPAGSVKDRPATNMIEQAQLRGDIQKGDCLIEATSGNTGIALAMAAAIKGYKMILIMPENLSIERRQAMTAYGAELILVTEEHGMEGARDLALAMEKQGKGMVLNQFSNRDNPGAHYATTGPELWQQTEGSITHFVSSMGTTGTIMGCSRFFKEKNKDIQIIGVQPDDHSQIPGIRKWPPAYLPDFFERHRVDQIMEITTHQAEHMTRTLAKEEGIFAGISSGGALHSALELAKTLSPEKVVVTIICDRGDRYLSTGVFQ